MEAFQSSSSLDNAFVSSVTTEVNEVESVNCTEVANIRNTVEECNATNRPSKQSGSSAATALLKRALETTLLSERLFCLWIGDRELQAVFPTGEACEEDDIGMLWEAAKTLDEAEFADMLRANWEYLVDYLPDGIICSPRYELAGMSGPVPTSERWLYWCRWKTWIREHVDWPLIAVSLKESCRVLDVALPGFFEGLRRSIVPHAC